MDNTKEIQARKSLGSLFIAVDESVARSVQRNVLDWVEEVKDTLSQKWYKMSELPPLENFEDNTSIMVSIYYPSARENAIGFYDFEMEEWITINGSGTSNDENSVEDDIILEWTFIPRRK